VSSEPLTVFIADDERPSREFLKACLSHHGNVTVVGEADNGADAVEMIRKLKPDLALLDLQMPEISGIEVARLLAGQQMPLVAFVTAFDEFAVQAFELNAVDYLLKPVDRERLSETIRRAASKHARPDWRESESERVRNASANYDAGTKGEKLDRIPLKKRDVIHLVPVSEIVSIIADGELLHFTTDSNQRYSINYRLKDLEPRLDERKFIRLSRSAIANLDQVASVQPLQGGTYQINLLNGQEIQSSRSQSKLLRTKLLKL
jgi:two-component system LytT family response regulator